MKEDEKIPWEQIPSKWKAEFEIWARNKMAHGWFFDFDSWEYRQLGERCYYTEKTTVADFEANLSRSRAISIVTKRDENEVLRDLEKGMPTRLPN